jgi:hypothetical protein
MVEEGGVEDVGVDDAGVECAWNFYAVCPGVEAEYGHSGDESVLEAVVGVIDGEVVEASNPSGK